MPTFLNNVLLSNNELQSVELEQLSSAPGSPTTGRTYYDTTLGAARIYTGSAWLPMTPFPEGRPAAGGTVYLTLPGVEVSASVSTSGLTANVIRYSPIEVHTPITIDLMAIEVTTQGAASTAARLGIFQSDTSLQPATGGLVLDAGTVAVDSLGFKSVSVSQPLDPGRYLLGIVSDGAPTLRAARGGLRLAGYQTALGTSMFNTTFPAALTYGTLPSNGPAWSSPVAGNTQFAYQVFVRVSTP